MRTVPLGDVCEVVMGQAPDGSTYNTEGLGWPLLAGAGDFGESRPNPTKFTSEPTKLSAEGDLILCIRATIGDLNWSDRPYCLGRGVAGLKPMQGKLHKGYLWHWLTANRRELAKRGKGSTFKQISRDDIKTFGICLPDHFDEQRRIAAILDKADAIRRKRQQALALADDFLRSAFLEMFGDIKAKKTKFPLQSIRGLVNASSGKSSKNVICDVQTDFPIYGGNGINGWASQALYNESVIVVGRVGQQCGITRLTDRPAWITDNAIAIRIADADRLDADYLEYALQMSPLRSTVQHLDLPFINQGIILDFPLPVPPIKEQRRFAEVKKEMLEIGNRARVVLRDMETLFTSLSQRAFRGEL